MPTPQDSFERYLVSEYFKHGSINKVFATHHFDLPISFAGYTRVLTKYQVVKSAGPNSNLSESLHVLTKIADYKIPLERIYHQYAPSTIQVSTNTLHRILHYTRLGLTRRQGTALIITRKDQPDYFLVGNDISLSNSVLGQKGDLSLPMAHSKIGEHPKESILRVLQQEVFTHLVLSKTFPLHLLPLHPRAIMFINIADIRVSVYHIELDRPYSLSSFKLTHQRFLRSSDLAKYKVRPGVEEILNQYSEICKSPVFDIAPKLTSKLNASLYAPAVAPVTTK